MPQVIVFQKSLRAMDFDSSLAAKALSEESSSLGPKWGNDSFAPEVGCLLPAKAQFNPCRGSLR